MSSPAPNHFHYKLLAPRYWGTWAALPLLWLLAWTPARLRHGLGRMIGRQIYHRNRKRRHIILTNLQLCFPTLSINEHDQLTKQTLENYACALLDYSILFFRSRQWLTQQVILEGQEKLDHTLNNQENIMLLLGHSAWLEFAPLAIGQHYPTYGSYKPIKNAVLNWLVARSRLNDVEFVIAREEGMVKLVRSLKPGQLLFFLPDEDHGIKHSVFAPFFAASKATLTTPARIAKLGKASCFPVMAFFDAKTGKYRISIGDQLTGFGQNTPEEDAEDMNSGLASLIGEHPEQYLWLLKLFRTSKGGETPPY